MTTRCILPLQFKRSYIYYISQCRYDLLNCNGREAVFFFLFFILYIASYKYALRLSSIWGVSFYCYALRTTNLQFALLYLRVLCFWLYEGNINVNYLIWDVLQEFLGCWMKALSMYCCVCTVIPAAGPAVVCTSLWWGAPACTVDIEG